MSKFKQKNVQETHNIPIQPSKICVEKNNGYIFKGSQNYTYGILGRQPASDYKIRFPDMERMRIQRLMMEKENDLRSSMRFTGCQELFEVADRKYLYNQIKRMVESEMKANEHLFLEKCSEPELKIEEEPKQSEIPKKYLLEKTEELKMKNDENERKFVEEKRLQMFIENSEELRCAMIAKRKKDIADINYKTIQEKERITNEQRIKKRELANLENLEIIRMQTREKEEEMYKLLEKKKQFRKKLHEQVQEKEVIRQQEKELKIIECNHLKIENQKLNEEIELEKLQQRQKQLRRKEEINKLIEERAKLFAIQKENKSLDETFTTTMRQNLKNEMAEEIEAKARLRRENELFKKYHNMVKEERKRQNENMSKIILKQHNEIEEIKSSIERESVEIRRKRGEEANKVVREQLKLRKTLLEQQKDTERKTFEQMSKEYEEYLKEEKQLYDKKKQFKWQIRKDLNDQINYRKDIIEKQRKIDLENHQKCMSEFVEQDKILKKLLNEL